MKRSQSGSKSCHSGGGVIGRTWPLDTAFPYIAWDGKAEIQGEVLLGDYQLHLHQEDSVMVGEDLVYSLILTPFINSVSCLLCQPPFWGCQSRPKLVPQEAEAVKADGNRCHKRFLLARHIQYTSRLVFAFFDSIVGSMFLHMWGWWPLQEASYKLHWLVDVLWKSQRGADPLPLVQHLNIHG